MCCCRGTGAAMNFFRRSPLERSTYPSAGLSRQPCARQPSQRWRLASPSACRWQSLPANRPVMARRALLGLASIVQTVPGLALLALFYIIRCCWRLTGLVADMVRSWLFRVRLPAGGGWRWALYSMLPVLRNTITGLQGVEACNPWKPRRGVGMTPRQSLFTVELPLALPVMMAGIRTAAVWGDRHPRHYRPRSGQTSPRQLHLCGVCRPRIGYSCCSAALAAAVLALAGRSIAGPDRNRHSPARAACGWRSAASASRRWSRRPWCPRWHAHHRATLSAPRHLPSNMSWRR